MFTPKNLPGLSAGPSPGQSPEPREARRSELRAISRFLWIVIALAAAVVGAKFYLRWEADQVMRQKSLERKREEDRRAVEMMGGNRFEILQFYASPAVIARGETVTLCYGVSNAKSVRLDPPAGNVWPSLNHCLDAAPLKDTTYTLTAQDGAGHIKTATLTVRVR